MGFRSKDSIIVPADELQEPASGRAGERASGRAGGRASGLVVFARCRRHHAFDGGIFRVGWVAGGMGG
jgi:hypothetical protein